MRSSVRTVRFSRARLDYKCFIVDATRYPCKHSTLAHSRHTRREKSPYQGYTESVIATSTLGCLGFH